MCVCARGLGLRPIDVAVRRNCTSVVRLLSEMAVRSSGGGAHEVHSTEAPLIHAARDALPNIVRVLLERGADVHARSQYGESALHCAAQSGSLEIIQLLWQHPEVHKGSLR